LKILQLNSNNFSKDPFLKIEKDDNAQLLEITDKKQINDNIPKNNLVERSLSPSIVDVETPKSLNRSKTVQVSILPLRNDSEIEWKRAKVTNSFRSIRSEPVLSSSDNNQSRMHSNKSIRAVLPIESNKSIRAMSPIEENEYEHHNRSSQQSNYSNKNTWYL